MKLEKIILNNAHYYQWIDDNGFVGDIFTEWQDIEYQKKVLELKGKKYDNDRKKTLGLLS